MGGYALILIGLMIFLAHVFAMLFSRKKLPDVLLLMLLGILIGPICGFISPDDFGKVGAVFTSITLVVILFEGGTDISISSLISAWRTTIRLTLTSFLMSVAIIGLVGLAFGISPLNSLIVAFILAGTSSAVVIPLARNLRLGPETKTTLILESALTDVLSIIFVLSCINIALVPGDVNLGGILGKVVASFAMSVLIGFVAALLWSSLLQKIRTIQNSMFLTPSFVFVVYGVADILEFSGAIAALSLGITIANVEYFDLAILRHFRKDPPLKLNINERMFMSEIVFFLKTFFFVYIGISIPFNHLPHILLGGLITVLLLIMRLIIARYFSPPNSNSFDKSIVGVMIPKGLAAAVLASIPEQLGIEGGVMIKEVSYSAVFISILLSSVMVILAERHRGSILGFRRFYDTNLSIREILSLPKKQKKSPKQPATTPPTAKPHGSTSKNKLIDR